MNINSIEAYTAGDVVRIPRDQKACVYVVLSEPVTQVHSYHRSTHVLVLRFDGRVELWEDFESVCNDD